MRTARTLIHLADSRSYSSAVGDCTHFGEYISKNIKLNELRNGKRRVFCYCCAIAVLISALQLIVYRRAS